MREVVVILTILVTFTLVQGQHHRDRHQRQWPYTPSGHHRDRYGSSNVVPSGPMAGEPGLPGLPGLQGPPGPAGTCECPEAQSPCAREGSVHMFEYYHDMAGSNIGIGSLAFISNTNDMWLKTRSGWQKIGWLK